MYQYARGENLCYISLCSYYLLLISYTKFAMPKPNASQSDFFGSMFASLNKVAARKAKIFMPESCLAGATD
jgi:hypothetical protein